MHTSVRTALRSYTERIQRRKKYVWKNMKINEGENGSKTQQTPILIRSSREEERFESGPK